MQKLVEMDEKMRKKGVFAIIFQTPGGLFLPGSQVFGQKLIYSTPRGALPARIFTVVFGVQRWLPISRQKVPRIKFCQLILFVGCRKAIKLFLELFLEPCRVVDGFTHIYDTVR